MLLLVMVHWGLYCTQVAFSSAIVARLLRREFVMENEIPLSGSSLMLLLLLLVLLEVRLLKFDKTWLVARMNSMSMLLLSQVY